MRMPLIASLACLAVAACASPVAPPLAQAHPITPTERYAIQVKPAPVELMLAAHSAGLSEAQSAALRDFMGRYGDTDRGAITIKVPAAIVPQAWVPSAVAVKTESPTVRGRLSGELITISGQRKSFQWLVTETMAKAEKLGSESGT